MEDVTSLITIEPWKNQQKNANEVELNKALTLLGFGAWSSLEPSKGNVRYLRNYLTIRSLLVYEFFLI